MSNLNIYRASAGSGKTFTLTMTYFMILFRAEGEYKHTLAVTFTNKATEEMKSRIIKELHALANGEKSGYAETLMNTFQLTDDTLKNKAAKLQAMLLHDYGHVAVSTIDRFFQSVIKSFTQELGIYPGYTVELDTDFVLQKAVTALMDETRGNQKLREWLSKLMSDNMREGESWIIKDSINELGREIFKEDYMQLGEETVKRMGDKSFMGDFEKKMSEIIRRYEEDISRYGTDGQRIINENNLLVSDFKYGSGGFAGHFRKITDKKKFSVFDSHKPSDRAREACNDISKWIKNPSTDEIDSKIYAVYPQLNSLLVDSIRLFDERYEEYLTAKLLKANLFQLGILGDLGLKVHQYCEENEVMLLSDTTKMLNSLIAGNDTPFLYEKVGNFYKHLMIDEFQDTSALQWSNFRPLMANSLSEGNQSMVVGDVKQSIYRWRNGDWSLLSRQVEQDFKHIGSPNKRTLPDNWRSYKEVVTFNNHFFSHAVKTLKNLYDDKFPLKKDHRRSVEMLNAYDRLEQNPKKGEGGYVDIAFGPPEKLKGAKNPEANPEIMRSVTEVIGDITARGGEQREIVILVRKGEEGAFVANYLMEYNTTADRRINFVSNDSLYVSSSTYVRFILAVLRFISDPHDRVNKAAMVRLYFAEIRKDDGSVVEGMLRHLDDDDLFGKAGIDFMGDVRGLLSYSLFETVEQIINLFSLRNKEEEVPYLVAFQDIVYDYETCNSNHVTLFLDWWEREQVKHTISTSEEVNAVRILTIHKAKGLEFEYVIVPFCSWKLNSSTPKRILWCKSDKPLFSGLEKMPLTYSKNLEYTYFTDSYCDEVMKTYVDGLNLLYVAFTRAKRELYVRPYGIDSPKGEKKGNIKDNDSFSLIIQHVITECFENQLSRAGNGKVIMQYGQKTVRDRSAAPKEDTPLTLHDYPVADTSNRINIHFKYNHKGNDDEDTTRSAIDDGHLLHEIFSRIDTVKDVDKAIREAVVDGLIRAEEQKSYKHRIEEYMTLPLAADWFREGNRSIKERDILLGNGITVRPDRVELVGGGVRVIDYKFGQEEKSRYNRQVQRYCQALKEMGYPSVQGYIWYVALNKVVAL